jgi:uncharacterized integral membrane protein
MTKSGRDCSKLPCSAESPGHALIRFTVSTFYYHCCMASTPSKYPWFIRKKTILIFILLAVVFEILGAITAYQLYSEYSNGRMVNWQRVLKPLWQAPGIVGMIYLCIVGFWLIFFLKKYQSQLLRNIGNDTWEE